LPASTGKKLPRYPTVPAVRMGRLAVDQAFKGQGLGGALLADALDRAVRAEIAAFATDGGRQGRGGSRFLPASRFHSACQSSPLHPVLAAGEPSSVL
jgi:predicted N-acetyltransferase YhbS